ncbi:MAG: MBL fold metallo-hydrolase [Candidatus Nanopelagicales bacterium]
MRLTVIGCAGSVPGPHSPASCYLVEHGSTSIVLDLGSGAFGALTSHVAVSAISAVFLTHLHADHCVDMAALAVAAKYGPDRPAAPIPVHAPPGARERIADIYGAPPDRLDEVFDYSQLQPVQTVGALTVRTAPMAHPVPAYALRCEGGGRALAYSGDTGPTPALSELARGVDLALFEASHHASTPVPPDLHLSGADAAQAATQAEAGRLVLTHLVPWVERGGLLTEAVAGFTGPVRLAEQGLVIDLEDS